MNKETILEEYRKKFGLCDGSLKYCGCKKELDFISKAIEQTREETIRDIRKHDEEELIKMFSDSPYKYIEIQQLIKYYYGK